MGTITLQGILAAADLLSPAAGAPAGSEPPATPAISPDARP
ncbi:MAG: hypothetical protein ACTHON_05690 [Humibacter sp.]